MPVKFNNQTNKFYMQLKIIFNPIMGHIDFLFKVTDFIGSYFLYQIANTALRILGISIGIFIDALLFKLSCISANYYISHSTSVPSSNITMIFSPSNIVIFSTILKNKSILNFSISSVFSNISIN